MWHITITNEMLKDITFHHSTRERQSKVNQKNSGILFKVCLLQI